jgi:hypothetical protein
MSDPFDPPRLGDDAGNEHASMLRAARAYRPSAEGRARTLAALGLAGATTTAAAGAAAGAGAKASGWGFGAKLGLSIVALALGGGGFAAWRAQSTPGSFGSKTNIVVSATPATPESVTAVPSDVVPPIVLSATATATSATAKSTKPKPTAAPASSSLAAEVAALDAASKALAGGDAAGALRRLDAYQKDHPNGALALEAQVLRIEALARTGDKARAKSLAQNFLKAHPTSVLAPRVRSILSTL